MILDPYAPPPLTPCDPHQVRDLVPQWRCTTVGPCDCGAPKTVEAIIDTVVDELTNTTSSTEPSP